MKIRKSEDFAHISKICIRPWAYLAPGDYFGARVYVIHME